MTYTRVRQEYYFDLKLAVDCASAYTVATELGCVVSDPAGVVLHESGLGCKECGICEAAGLEHEACVCSHIRGTNEARRFGGKYIYFCPMGLTCFVSPITGSNDSAGAMIAGPFLMVDLDDYISYDLKLRRSLSKTALERIAVLVKRVPYVAPRRVDSLSTVLYTMAAYINRASEDDSIIDLREPGLVLNQITDYMLERKNRSLPSVYPIKTEKNLLACIAEADKPKARKLLNKLLGHIFFTSGDDMELIKSKTYDLMVIISRAAIDAGLSANQAFKMNHRFWKQVKVVESIDGFCVYLSDIINRYVDSIFSISETKSSDIVREAIEFIEGNYVKKITLEDTARAVYLSPTYFSKVFQKATGHSFSTYLSRVRVDAGKKLLLSEKIRLGDIAVMVGFDDQSYFTKVFTRITGTTPGNYRKSNSWN